MRFGCCERRGDNVKPAMSRDGDAPALICVAAKARKRQSNVPRRSYTQHMVMMLEHVFMITYL